MASKEFLTEFMEMRFPRERPDSSYWKQWEGRLNTGDPRVFMDKDTLKVFNKLKKKWGIA